MTLIRKYRFGDLMNSVMDDMGMPDFWNPVGSSTYNGRWVDTDKYDVVPKKQWYVEQVKRIEEELFTLERRRDATLEYYENQKKSLLEKKERLEREKGKQEGG